jgi:hypothetical protein
MSIQVRNDLKKICHAKRYFYIFDGREREVKNDIMQNNTAANIRLLCHVEPLLA